MDACLSDGNAALGFGLVCAAGLSTTLGAAVVCSPRLVQLTSKRVLATALGLSAGVMLYVSFVEIFFKSFDSFEQSGLGERDAYLFATLCFFAGFVFMKLVHHVVHRLERTYGTPGGRHRGEDSAAHDGCADAAEAVEDMAVAMAALEIGAGSPGDGKAAVRRLPVGVGGGGDGAEAGNATPGPGDDEAAAGAAAAEDAAQRKTEDETGSEDSDRKLVRMGVMTAVAIGLHNFPEGLATFVATLADPAVGVALAVAIAMHNIPEGLAVSVPIYFSTGSRFKAFMWALLSGVSEPIGAGLGWLALCSVISEGLYAVLFGVVGGMMVNIVLSELLPTAHRYDPHDRVVTNSVLAGMLVMAASLVLFVYS